MSDEKIIQDLEEAVRRLEQQPEFAALMPEVRMNFVYARPDAQNTFHVAGVDGRITVVAGRPHAAGPVRWGASDHLARLVLLLRQYDPQVASALNFKWDQRILDVVRTYCEEKKLDLGVIDRRREPKDVAERDGESMPWKVKELTRQCGGKVPPLFYETEGWGKEPLFVAVGATPEEVLHTVSEIARRVAHR